MGDSGAVAFGSALLGAAVGGGASLLGSIVVERRKLTRESRVRMFDELLPRLMQARQVPMERPPLEAIHRAAILAGRSDQRSAAHILRLWDEMEEISRAEQGVVASRESMPATTAASQRLDAALSSLHQRLARRVR